MHWPLGRRGRNIPPNPCHCEGHGTDFLCTKYYTQKTVLLLEGEAKPISELLVRAGVERRHLGEALFPSPRAIMSPKPRKLVFLGICGCLQTPDNVTPKLQHCNLFGQRPRNATHSAKPLPARSVQGRVSLNFTAF